MTTSTRKIAVVGTGGTGSVIGGMLTVAGHDVVMIDQWGAHVDAMKANGLHMSIAGEEFTSPVRALHLYEVCTLEDSFDVVFLACKSYDTLWLTQLILPYLKDDGVLVSTQNSLNDEWIAPVVGPTRDIGCVLTMSSEVFEPGHLKRNTAMDRTTFVLGELHGRITPRLQELQSILGAAGKTELTTNLWGTRWSKLVFNSIVAPVCALAGVGPAHLTDAPERIRVCLELGRERCWWARPRATAWSPYSAFPWRKPPPRPRPWWTTWSKPRRPRAGRPVPSSTRTFSRAARPRWTTSTAWWPARGPRAECQPRSTPRRSP